MRNQPLCFCLFFLNVFVLILAFMVAQESEIFRNIQILKTCFCLAGEEVPHSPGASSHDSLIETVSEPFFGFYIQKNADTRVFGPKFEPERGPHPGDPPGSQSGSRIRSSSQMGHPPTRLSSSPAITASGSAQRDDRGVCVCGLGGLHIVLHQGIDGRTSDDPF